ncbi:DNA polymerase III subunit delta [uncultured Sphingomonas sp.]|uniref:DNA polymerase III subunit delta n=1 Tax=uncultured Sphingomonas sp. TaxID=158754 RepID=UPI0035CBD0DE
MKANAGQVRAALDHPRHRLILLHGPDAGLAAELAARLGKAMGDGAERVDLDGPALKVDPARLADEAASLSLFGDKRWIRVAGVGEESVPAIAALLEAERAGNPVLAVAPTAKATSKLVKLALDAKDALAFACYPPSPADLERQLAGTARELGLRVDPLLLRRLVAASGGESAIAVRELEKFALYLDADPDRPADLTPQAFDDLAADLGEAEAGRLVESVLAGDPALLGNELTRLRESGVSPIPWLRQLQRRLLSLAAMRADLDGGEPVDAVMKRHRVFFREEQATARALRAWGPDQLARALTRIRAAERAIMAPGNAGPVLAEQAVETIARAQARRR